MKGTGTVIVLFKNDILYPVKYLGVPSSSEFIFKHLTVKNLKSVPHHGWQITEYETLGDVLAEYPDMI